ncbi:hypothetical protein PIB30_083332 [Stylosanthes scabra]|uniref:Uncharacterized protein n=1 Tax=Stylosanthes scabra TaxID=79078 RepID=A0ABU6RSI4_9FABA|nr:hypothetical protein [Stylosanthes scabra]
MSFLWSIWFKEKGAVLLENSRSLYKVKSEMKYDMKNYYMEYYFETNPDVKHGDWNFDLHDLQLCFGVKEFLVIAPQSASGVLLDAPEASKLLSAVAIALSNCSSSLVRKCGDSNHSPLASSKPLNGAQIRIELVLGLG